MSQVHTQARSSTAREGASSWALVACIGITVAFLLTNVWLYDSVVQLIGSSSNPRFAIFMLAVTVVGQGLAIYQALLLSQESGLVQRLRQAVQLKRGAPLDIQRSALGQFLTQERATAEISALFDPLRTGRDSRSADDRAADLRRLQAYEVASARRLVLPGHIANTLIGLGLFGTFLGLIVTLKDVASLIGVIAVAGDGDSAATMNRFFTQMSGPLGGMGQAFVASLLGLGGSMVNGLQILALRRLQVSAVAQTGAAFHVVVDALGGHEPFLDELEATRDDRMTRLQVEAITSLRQDLAKQTEAILLAASKMRLASDSMQAMAAVAEKRLGSDETRAQVEKVAAVIAQRLETMSRKFDDIQVAQNSLAAAVQTGAGALDDIKLQAKFIADHNGQAVREMAGLRSALVDASVQARDNVTQMHAELRAALQRDLATVVSAVGDANRDMREQNVLLGQIGGHAHETNLALQSLDGGLRDLSVRVQPQVVELVARLEAAGQADSMATKYELADLHRKFDEMSIELLRQTSERR